MKEKIKAQIEYLKERDITIDTNREIQFLQSLLVKEGVGLKDSGMEIEISLQQVNNTVHIFAKNIVTNHSNTILSINKNGITRKCNLNSRIGLPLDSSIAVQVY